MIKLVKHSLTPAGRFEVESCSMTLSEKDSQIVMTLGPDAMELQIGDWLLENEDPGAGIVWRVKTIETDYQTSTRRVTAEHIIQTLRDAVIFGTVDAETMGGSDGVISAAGAIGYALSQCADWQRGTIGYNTSQAYEFNGDSVLEAIETVCTTLVDPWWSYDLSSYPFTLNINPKSSAAQCEMRAERNIATLRRTVDISRMYTRIYPVGKDDLHIEGDYLSQNENLYGVIAKVETDQSKETAGMLQAWAAARLARHCNPSVTIQITGANLSASTGEPLDHLQIGVGCRVPLPEFNTTILETISKLQWKDKKADPESVTVTLANDWEDVASIMRREIASGSGTTGKAGRTRSKQQKEDHAWFVDTDDHVAMVAEAIAGTDGQGKPNWSRVSTLTVDGNGIDSRVTTTESGLVTAQSAIVQTENSISMSVGTLKGLTLETFPKKKNFPAAGAANKIYLDQETGIYWVYVGGEYKRAKFATDGEGHPITDQSGKIAEVHYTKAGEIALAINEQGESEAHIDAKKVILGKSELTADDLEQWAIDGTGPGSGVFAEFLTVRELTAQEIRTMLAEIENAYVEDEMDVGILCVDTLKVDVNGENYSNVSIYDASVASNVLTIYCTNGQNINFSKATSLSATWTGDNTTAQATFAISATQSNKNTTTGQIETVEVATDQASAAAKTTTIEVKQSKAAAYVVTVGASGGKSDGAIIARIDNPQYGNGWAAAYGKVSLPTTENTSTASFSVETPPSTVDGNADTETYTLSNPLNNVAVIKNSAGTIVARLQHNKYDSGWTAAYGKVSLPTTENTSTASFSVETPPSTVGGNADTETYTLSNPQNNVAVVKNTAGTIVARLEHNKYDAGWTAAYGKVSLPTSASTAASFNVETPPSTVGGNADTETYTLSNPQNNVAVVKNTAGTIVARLEHNKYNAGFDAVSAPAYSTWTTAPSSSAPSSDIISNTIKFTTDDKLDPSLSAANKKREGTKTVALTQDSSWSNDHKKNVYLRNDNSSGSYVGRIEVDASGVFTDGQNDIINAGGAVSKDSNNTWTLNQYVTTLTVAVPIPDTTATYNYAARYGSWLDDFGASTAAQSATIAGYTDDEDGVDIAYQGELKAGWMYGLYYIKSNSSKYYKAYWKVPDIPSDYIPGLTEETANVKTGVQQARNGISFTAYYWDGNSQSYVSMGSHYWFYADSSGYSSQSNDFYYKSK